MVLFTNMRSVERILYAIFTDSTSTGAGCTCSPCNTGAGSTWSLCNNCRTTPSAFLHQQLDVTAAASEVNPVACMIQFGSAAKNFAAPRLNPSHPLLTSRPVAP